MKPALALITLFLAGCATTAGSGSHGLTYAETATRAELSYGAADPRDDRQSLNLACDKGSGRIEVGDRVVKKDGVTRATSAGDRLVLGHVSIVDSGGDLGDPYTPISAPPFAALRATGRLTVGGNEDFTIVADRAGRVKIERFFKACS